MNTPITDRYYQSRIGRTGEEMPFQFARRLELDRAALMEALELSSDILTTFLHFQMPTNCEEVSHNDIEYRVGKNRSVIDSARANFPD